MSVWDLIYGALPKLGDARQRPVLSFTGADGYPFSLRCSAAETEHGGHRCFDLAVPPDVDVPDGPGWLLWHRHDAELGGMMAFSLSGRLARTESGLAFTPQKVAGRVGLSESASPNARSAMIRDAEAYLRESNLAEPEMNWQIFEDMVRQAER